MGKKIKGALTFVLLATLSLGGIAYFSSGFSNWTADGWRDRLTPVSSEEPPVSSEEPPVSSEEPPVSSEEYRIVLNKNYNYSLSFVGPQITNATTLAENFNLYDNLISLSLTTDDVIISVSSPDVGDSHYLEFLYLDSWTYLSLDYMFIYLDPVSNNPLYGTYDFSNIILTEADQVLNPIYTPF